MGETDGTLTRNERHVLSMCDVPRRSGDIAFLENLDRAVVDQAVERLARSGLIEVGLHQLWRQTDAGVEALRSALEWSVTVNQILSVSGHIAIVVCTVRSGVVCEDDWFLCNGAARGRVSAVELPARATDRADLVVTITVAGKVRPGDVLTRYERRFH